MPRFSEPFSVPDPDAVAWDDMVRRNRLLQAKNDPWVRSVWDGDAGVTPWAGSPTLDDDMPMPDWQAARNAQVKAGDSRAGRPAVQLLAAPGALRGVAPSVVAATTSSGPPKPTASSGLLRGRPGTAALVAGALNTIAGGPNTSARITGDHVDGVIARGGGRDVTADAKVFGFGTHARGTIDPQTGRREISVSGLNGNRPLPSHVRVYNTPSGELDLDLSGPANLGLIKKGKGIYVIGQPDPPKKTK